MSHSSQKAAPPKKPISLWKRLLRSVVLGYVLLIVILLVFQRDLIYHPTRADRLSAKDAASLVDVHDFEFTGEDGETLHGWHFSRALSESHPEDLSDSPRVVLYFPGNAGNRSYRVTPCEMLANYGCDVLIADYRGYGENSGSPNEEKFVNDAMSLWKHVTEEMHVPHDRIVLFGESLGGGVATQLAAAQSRKGAPPEGLVIQSSFNSLADVAQRKFFFLPAKWLVWDRFDSAANIGDIKCRYLHLHGDQDEVVPYACGRELYASAPDSIEKQFVTIEDGGHNDLYSDSRHFIALSRAIKIWLEAEGAE
ncbi:MAG: alpha/beta hydrolase [Planctomycetaceae bacterium]|nr:alpha/beta hydrolase [Planctomycetaceae bacterium]